MRRITPAPPNVILYESGFSGNDLLSRADIAKNLSSLLDEVDEPLVIAVDGDWGEGKSFFLKCWAGAHKNEFGGKARIVYFDAFAKDFLQDPLIGLVAALEERFSKHPTEPKGLSDLRKAIEKLGRPALRVSLAAATAGITELVGPILDAVADSSAQEIGKGIDTLWEQEKIRQDSISEFKESLATLTCVGDRKENLIFIVDELDRCRPDYAIELLEVIKHFFEIPNVHFVLGVNLKELEASVRTRYGSTSNAHAYLSKHIKLKLMLPRTVDVPQGGSTSAFEQYYRAQVKSMSLPEEFSGDVLLASDLISPIASLRDANAILSLISLIPFRSQGAEGFQPGYRLGLACLVAIKYWRPDIYQKILDRKPIKKEALGLFPIPSSAEKNLERRVSNFRKVISAFCEPDDLKHDDSLQGLFQFSEAPGIDAFIRLAQDHLETFKRFQ